MHKQTRILFGITTKSHTEIALDEMYGLQEIGYICDQFEFGGKKNFKSTLSRGSIIVLNSIKLLIKAYKFKPDFIYLNSRVEFSGSARDFVTILLVKLFYFKKIRFLIKSHGSNLEALESKQFFFRAIVFPFLKFNVSGWLFLSTEELTWVISHKLLAEQKLFLAKNIVRVQKFQTDSHFREKLNIPSDSKILLFVGRIIKEKGLEYVVNAFSEVRKKNKVFLIIVGDGEELDTIKERIEILNIKNDILITGWIDENKATYFTSNSDVLIYPTFAPEGFPMALFNSLAAGLSVVTTQIRAASDYLDEPQNCLWVQPRSSSSIAEAIEKLFSNKELIEQMRINNKQKSQVFTKCVVAQELSAIINSIEMNTYDKQFIEVKK